MLGNISRVFVVCCFFRNHYIFKTYFSYTIKESNSLVDPCQGQHFVRPDLDSKCLQKLHVSADNTRGEGYYNIALQMEHSFFDLKILHINNFTLRVCMGIEIAKP